VLNAAGMFVVTAFVRFDLAIYAVGRAADSRALEPEKSGHYDSMAPTLDRFKSSADTR
jgi:hypothetical protein